MSTAITTVDVERVNAWLNLIQAGSVVSEAVEQALQENVRLSLPEHEVLVRLSGTAEGRLPMHDLADLLLVSKSGVTRLVDRMVRDGLVERASCATDRRIVYASLTPEGRRRVREAEPVFERALDERFSAHLGDMDVRRLRSALRKVLEGNGAWEDDRCTRGLSAISDSLES